MQCNKVRDRETAAGREIDRHDCAIAPHEQHEAAIAADGGLPGSQNTDALPVARLAWKLSFAAVPWRPLKTRAGPAAQTIAKPGCQTRSSLALSPRLFPRAPKAKRSRAATTIGGREMPEPPRRRLGEQDGSNRERQNVA